MEPLGNNENIPLDGKAGAHCRLGNGPLIPLCSAVAPAPPPPSAAAPTRATTPGRAPTPGRMAMGSSGRARTPGRRGGLELFLLLFVWSSLYVVARYLIDVTPSKARLIAATRAKTPVKHNAGRRKEQKWANGKLTRYSLFSFFSHFLTELYIERKLDPGYSSTASLSDSDDDEIHLQSIDVLSRSAFQEALKPENKDLVDAYLMRKNAPDSLVALSYEAVRERTNSRKSKPFPNLLCSKQIDDPSAVGYAPGEDHFLRIPNRIRKFMTEFHSGGDFITNIERIVVAFLHEEKVSDSVLASVSEPFRSTLARPMKIVRVKGGDAPDASDSQDDNRVRVLRITFNEGLYRLLTSGVCAYYGGVSKSKESNSRSFSYLSCVSVPQARMVKPLRCGAQ